MLRIYSRFSPFARLKQRSSNASRVPNRRPSRPFPGSASSEGDTVHLVETEEGILITPFDPAFDEAMEIYAEGAKRYRNAMRELAK